MNKLFIKKLNANRSVSTVEAENLLEKNSVSNPIRVINWKEFDYLPTVNFRIGHIDNEIWLKFYVREKYIRAVETRINGEVYKDSCVEFFISPDGKSYYNFEFSCIGTIHLAWGEGRHNRRPVSPELIKNITAISTLGDKPFNNRSGDFEWEMMIRIPIESLSFNNLQSLSGLKATANFYKCGDETDVPHYVTWNPIKTENPDYHRPEFFGKIEFE